MVNQKPGLPAININVFRSFCKGITVSIKEIEVKSFFTSKGGGRAATLLDYAVIAKEIRPILVELIKN
ncbi:MAG: hypothetical protein COA78_08540 [Blastopirellula sp.]|nr:MAG: hypothetical protein COA78_08540 [Blastopirellula sp.]